MSIKTYSGGHHHIDDKICFHHVRTYHMEEENAIKGKGTSIFGSRNIIILTFIFTLTSSLSWTIPLQLPLIFEVHTQILGKLNIHKFFTQRYDS